MLHVNKATISKHSPGKRGFSYEKFMYLHNDRNVKLMDEIEKRRLILDQNKEIMIKKLFGQPVGNMADPSMQLKTDLIDELNKHSSKLH